MSKQYLVCLCGGFLRWSMARSVALNCVPMTEKRARLVELLATAIRWLKDVRNFTQKGNLARREVDRVYRGV